METKINWDEINIIIQERSSKQSYMLQPNEMSPIDLEKIGFLISEINEFPDNQKKVSESGTLFEKYLSDKYCELSPKSIDRLVHRFCFLNK
ncbi:hypothetical protein [Sulfuricurvum sp.]|uniref:hypothetical protein n=1 Tax=Sulfuricurvum sp. TaxID=2025608 RepID=UPI0026343F3A|nr:hypothetical protein [Sulfuricurvum sp.]MDD2782229.1 hypothetical protein [Sulfuricurvum sp.]